MAPWNLFKNVEDTGRPPFWSHPLILSHAKHKHLLPSKAVSLLSNPYLYKHFFPELLPG